MKTIRMTKAIAKEIGEAIATAVCGHAPDELSYEAKRIYKEMLDCEFKFNAIVDGVEYPYNK